MPMHDFRCNKCLNYWEDYWHLSEHDVKSKEIENKTYKCPSCQSTDIQKFFNTPGVRFVGEAGKSGFYALDYANVEGKDTTGKAQAASDQEYDAKSFPDKIKNMYKDKLKDKE